MTHDLNITSLDIEYLQDLVKAHPNDKDSPIIRVAEILLKLARKSL